MTESSKIRFLAFAFVLTALLFLPYRTRSEEEVDYFPLHVGDSWTYIRNRGGLNKIVIKDKVMIEGKEYYHWVDFFSNRAWSTSL